MSNRLPLIVRCAGHFMSIGRDTTAATAVHLIGLKNLPLHVRTCFPGAKILRIDDCDESFARYQVHQWAFPELEEIFVANSTPQTAEQLIRNYFSPRVKVTVVVSTPKITDALLV